MGRKLILVSESFPHKEANLLVAEAIVEYREIFPLNEGLHTYCKEWLDIYHNMDETNFNERLLQYGCDYKQVNVKCVHLFEKRYNTWGQNANHVPNEGYYYNQKVYDKIKGELIVNKDIEWGVLEN